MLPGPVVGADEFQAVLVHQVIPNAPRSRDQSTAEGIPLPACRDPEDHDEHSHFSLCLM